jgi:hypothetical protein
MISVSKFLTGYYLSTVSAVLCTRIYYHKKYLKEDDISLVNYLSLCKSDFIFAPYTLGADIYYSNFLMRK